MSAPDRSHARFLDTARFASLDGLRFLSIVPVVWHHSTSRPRGGVLGKGPLGVDLFFAISGFLITTLLLRERKDTGRLSVARFYLRRVLRIFPLYYGVLGLYVLRALVFLPDGPQRSHFFHSLPYYATFTSNWFVDFDVPHPVIFAFAWSLAVEEQFYLVWPWIVKESRLWLVPSVALGLLLLHEGVALGWLNDVLAPGTFGWRVIRSLASPICMGALLACGLHHARSFGVLSRILGARWASPCVFLVLVALVVADGVPLVAVQLVLTLFVGACSIRPDHLLAPITDAPPVRFIGQVSYAMYMLHVSAVAAARSFLPSRWSTDPIIFAVAFPATLALAAMSRRWLETPLADVRARLRSSRESDATDVTNEITRSEEHDVGLESAASESAVEYP